MACKCGTPNCAGPADKDWVDECIAKSGWAGMGVMAGEGKPGFNYTIGLTAMGHPELIVFGLPYEVGHFILGAAIERIAEIHDGAVLDGIANMPTAFRAVPPGLANEEYLVQAKHYFGDDVEVMQVVWPDRKGLFPWQAGCLPRMVEMQGGLVDFAAEQGTPGPRRTTAGRLTH